MNNDQLAQDILQLQLQDCLHKYNGHTFIDDDFKNTVISEIKGFIAPNTTIDLKLDDMSHIEVVLTEKPKLTIGAHMHRCGLIHISE